MTWLSEVGVASFSIGAGYLLVSFVAWHIRKGEAGWEGRLWERRLPIYVRICTTLVVIGLICLTIAFFLPVELPPPVVGAVIFF